jgi:hypothetical protein
MSEMDNSEDGKKQPEDNSFGAVFLRFLKMLGMLLGGLVVIVILLFGLALGACFLGGRR